MKKLVKITALAVAASLAFTSCGGSKNNSKVSSSKGAEFILNNGTEPQSLDPSKIQGVPEHRIYMALFEGLTSYDPKTSKAVPGVAESWEREDDGSVVVFHLRKTSWSDGTPITAQTFIDSWLYYMAPETAAEYAYMPAAVIKGAEDYNAGKADKSTVGLKARDEYTLEVTLNGPIAYAIDMMGHYSFAPLPLHVMNNPDWTKPGNFVGNGPFTLETWKPQECITVIPNEKYWNKDNVFLSRITFLTIENETTAYNKFKNKEMDWDTSVPLEMLDDIKLSDEYHVSPQLSSYYYEFNLTDPVLSDVRIRKALQMSLDRQMLVDQVTKGGQIPADAFVPPMDGYTPAKGNGYNVAKARELLAEAGYPEGKGFPVMTVIYNTNEGHKKIAEYVQQQWKQNLGIDIALENMEWATFLDKRQSHDFQIARAGWNADYQDASNFLELWITDGGNNDGCYSNAEYDALLKQAAGMPDGSDRQNILRKAEELLMTEDQGIISFYYYVSQNMIDLEKWDGWYMNTLDIHPYVGLKARK